MGKILKFYGPGDVRFDHYEEEVLQPGQVRLETLYSGISAGTEMSHFRGTNPFRKKVWDPERQLFIDKEDDAYYPRGTGYEEVGRVCEIAGSIAGIKTGDIVYGHWSHKSTHVLDGEIAAKHLLPAGLKPVLGIFSQIGAIAFNGILDAKINLGETVAIFGQGTPGLIAMQLAKLSGAEVIAVDINKRRLEVSGELGADFTINPEEASSAERIKDITGNRGADVSIEFSGSLSALSEAIRATVYGGRVVASGFYQGGGQLALGEEFHHNRIGLVCSQIGGIAQEYSNRWNMDRIYKTIMDLQVKKLIDLDKLISHIEKFEDAEKIYKLIDQHSESVLQGVLDFGIEG